MTRIRLPRLTLLLALLACAACRLADARVHNLKALHEEDGSARRRAALVSEIEFFFQRVFGQLGINPGTLPGAREKPIDDPFAACLRNLLKLAEYDAREPRVAALQAEIFAWLAADDDFALSRERSVLELGPLGQVLAIDGPLALASDARPATAAELAGLLQGLLEAAAPVLRGETFGAERLGAACGAVESCLLDLDGARRMLAASTILLDRAGWEAPELERVRELNREMQRRAIALALSDALADEEALVRAAALRAAVRAGRASAGDVLWAALGDPAPQVLAEALRILRQRGPPARARELDATAAGQTATEVGLEWAARVVRVIQTQPDGEVSVAACRAMRRLSGAERDDLRPESWVAWLRERSAVQDTSSGGPR
jgi:hypothetical protein